MKIIAASDFHIGNLHDDKISMDDEERKAYKNRHYEMIGEFVERMKINEKPNLIVLCGDIFDLWRFDYKGFIDEDELEDFLKNEDDRELIRGAIKNIKDLINAFPTVYIWGNHDCTVEKRIILPVMYTDRFKIERIYFCHGWRFDIVQRIFSFIFGWMANWFNGVFKLMNRNTVGQRKNKIAKLELEIKKLKDKKQPTGDMQKELKSEEDKYGLNRQNTHRRARNFLKKRKNNVKYLIMGHTHCPDDTDGLFDCGDMINSFKYVRIVDGEPELISMLDGVDEE